MRTGKEIAMKNQHGVVVKTFITSAEASRETGIYPTCISQSLKGVPGYQHLKSKIDGEKYCFEYVKKVIPAYEPVRTINSHNVIYNEDCIQGMKKIPSGSVNMVLTDIPYGEVNDRAANSEICYLDKGVADVVNFNLETLTETLIEKTCENGSIYMFCGTEQISTIVKVMRKNGLSTRVITWEKTNPCPLNGKRIWLSGTEFCVFGRKKGATFNGHCKNNVLRYPIYHNKIHKTPKPVGLFEELITTSSNEGDTILDPFMGSGTTAIACMQTNRKYIGFELDKDYYNSSLERIDKERQDITTKIGKNKECVGLAA